ncbi:uncharacterized protein LOC142979121 [Anticarsia gemmatalis]|uniref:uncharacterized protein LOC142979121 n=1 Tax=Anticarsia gemmatalis TaxID=129554 RepID=UPI003F760CBA
MEPPKGDSPKLPDMVMCGDHPSLTKTELNMKEVKMDNKLKEKVLSSHARILPASSRTEGMAHSMSEHALRLHDARRRARELERERQDQPGTRPIVQAFPWAALGSFRWPPYLLAVWVLVLVLTHLLHCLVSVLDKMLPALKKCTQYFRAWTEDSWKNETDMNQRFWPVGLAAVTGVLYAAYFALYAIYAVVVWAIEPLCNDIDDTRSAVEFDAKVTDYVDEANSKTNSSIKQ